MPKQVKSHNKQQKVVAYFCALRLYVKSLLALSSLAVSQCVWVCLCVVLLHVLQLLLLFKQCSVKLVFMPVQCHLWWCCCQHFSHFACCSVQLFKFAKVLFCSFFFSFCISKIFSKILFLFLILPGIRQKLKRLICTTYTATAAACNICTQLRNFGS